MSDTAERIPFCFISGGSYSADLAGTEVVAGKSAQRVVWLHAAHPTEPRGPTRDWGPSALFEWLASQTEGMSVLGFEYSGDPHIEASVGRVRLRSELVAGLRSAPDQLYRLTPTDFELLVCDRLDAMGLDPIRIGGTNTPDGGADVLAVPRSSPIPFLMAVQIKHRSRPGVVGPQPVRELEALASRDDFNIGMLVTNASFSPDAHWVANTRRSLLRLRDIKDVVAWLHDQFHSHEIGDLPQAVELRPGLSIPIPWPSEGREPRAD
jgi:hypothetical protein